MQKEDTTGHIRMEVKLLNGADVILQLVRSPSHPHKFLFRAISDFSSSSLLS